MRTVRRSPLASVAVRARAAFEVETGRQLRQFLGQDPTRDPETPLPGDPSGGAFPLVNAEVVGFEPTIGLKPETRLAEGLPTVRRCPYMAVTSHFTLRADPGEQPRTRAH